MQGSCPPLRNTVSFPYASLLQSFSVVPPDAAPAIVDCVIACSGITPSDLLRHLMQASSDLFEAQQSNYILSYTSALCHLITKSDTIQDSLLLFIRKLFVLLEKVNPNDSVLINNIVEKLCAVVSKTRYWDLAGTFIVLPCLKSLGFCDKELLDLKCIVQGSIGQQFKCAGPFLACRVLIVLMEYVLKIFREPHNIGCQLLDGFDPGQSCMHCSVDKIFSKLVHDLSNLVPGMLMQSQEHRSLVLHYLLPHLLVAYNELASSRATLQISACLPSRVSFYEGLWKCCASLLLNGDKDRIVAYIILSWYFISFFNLDHQKDKLSEEFDITNQVEFWDEIRKGLVDRKVSVRKQALYILKLSISHFLCLSYDDVNCSSSTSIEHGDSYENQNLGSIPQARSISHSSLKKKELWADKEAKLLGVGEVCKVDEQCLRGQDRWKIFIFLYEMLEEYGTHLVEAAWLHQVSLFFQEVNTSRLAASQIEMEITEGIFNWLAVLWERGFFHNNPQVRRLVMQSFLGIAWSKYDGFAKKVPRSFVLGAFISSLNDVVHHKEFGLKGIYTSKVIQDSSIFFDALSRQLSFCERITLINCLGSAVRKDSFGRAGLMALAFCISSVGGKPGFLVGNAAHSVARGSLRPNLADYSEMLPDWASSLLDVLGFVIERSNHHFNQRYRAQVCEQVLKAAFLVKVSDVPLDVVLRFLSNVPHEFTDISGPLRQMVEHWLCPINECCSINQVDCERQFVERLIHFPASFLEYKCRPQYGQVAFDDEDVDAWWTEVRRWARVLFLVNSVEQHLEQIFLFIRKQCSFLCSWDVGSIWIPMKLFILILVFLEEFEMRCWKISCYNNDEIGLASHKRKILLKQRAQFDSDCCEKLANAFGYMLEDLLCYAKSAHGVFWSSALKGAPLPLPSSIIGKLGGPSQRRLSSHTATAALEAIFCTRTIASIMSWCFRSCNQGNFDSAIDFLREFCWKVIGYSTNSSEIGAELHLAAFESLVYIFKALSTSFTSSIIYFIVALNESQQENEEGLLDLLILNFMQSINSLLSNGMLTRSRRAILLNWKWLCLHSLLSISYHATQNEVYLPTASVFISDSTLRFVFADIVESLENAVDDSVLPMLRSVRLILGLLCSCKMISRCSGSHGVNAAMMMQLVQSSWILHLSCNKRRVAPIAAILSSVVHEAVFGDISMHETNGNKQGPLKWFIQKFLEEGVRSPRTIRLAALHLTGLWLLYPSTIKFYIKELKLLTLYGSVAFDEDFESELSENVEANTEVSFLAHSLDFELKEIFINTEMFARVSVAVMFYSLGNLASRETEDRNNDYQAALFCGKLFLSELLNSAVHDKDLSKELYKKYSGAHRRKVRVWQMICVLSRFVDEDIVEEVTLNLHICLTRNNLPAVRQYLELFAIQVYLKFPLLAEKQLIPIFYNYSMRPQAISSYVFIASNIILHATDISIKIKHLNKLLPPIIPFLTSHHHSLRGFSQLLIYHVLSKLWPLLELGGVSTSFEKKSFEDLKSYLTENADCARLRASMDGFLNIFHPEISASPSGIFSSCNEGVDFECAPVSLMEQVIEFLNDARDELRDSIAKDSMTIKNESFYEAETTDDAECFPSSDVEGVFPQTKNDILRNFQKKVKIDEHALQQTDTDERIIWNADIPKLFLEMEKEDHLLSPVVQSRNEVLERIKASRQQFILVASLLDRIPNIAGLVRTCEIFKAAGLAIADTRILQDKQFQLISVTAEKWVPVIEVPVSNMKGFFEKKRREGFSILGLEQTANSMPLSEYIFPQKTVLVLGREREGIPVDILNVLDACVEIPQMGIIRSLNVHVSGAIALWEYTRQQTAKKRC